MLHRFPEGVGRREDLPEAAAEGRARLGRDGRGALPVRPHRRRAVRDRAGRVVWAVQMSTVEFHPWHTRRARVEQPGRAAHRPRPAARHRLRRREAGRRRGARGARRARLRSAGRRRPATAACTSTCGSSRDHGFTRGAPGRARVRPRGRAPDAGRRSPPPGGRRSAASRSSSTSTRTPRTARSRAAYSVRGFPHGPVSAPVTWDELPRRRDGRLHHRDDAGAVRRARRPARRASTTSHSTSRRCWNGRSGTSATTASATRRTRRTIRRCRASRPGCSPARSTRTTGRSPNSPQTCQRLPHP